MITNEELLAQYRKTGDKELRDQLILQNMGLIKKIANRYFLDGRADYDFEDLVQVGVIGLMKAIDLYDPSYGAKFSTYAGMWIRQVISRSLEGCESWISLQEPIKGSEETGDGLNLEDTIADPRDIIQELEEEVAFSQIALTLKKELTDLQYKIFIYRAAGMTYAAIAEKCGTTFTRVKQEIVNSRHRLMKPKLRLLLREWLDRETIFYRSPTWDQPKAGKTYKFSSIVEDAVLQREYLIEKLTEGAFD